MPPPRQRVAILLQGKAKADDGRATRRDAVTRSIYLYTRLCGTLPFLLSDALTWCACVRAKPSWRILSGSLELAIPAALILFVIAFRRSFKLNDALFARSSAHACRDDPPGSSAVSFQRVQWHSLGVRATSPRHGFHFNACTLAPSRKGAPSEGLWLLLLSTLLLSSRDDAVMDGLESKVYRPPRPAR